LAVFDDATRGGDVLTHLNKKFGSKAADCFQACNKGTHSGYSGDMEQLVRDTKKITGTILELT
jgi:hypothetical protein